MQPKIFLGASVLMSLSLMGLGCQNPIDAARDRAMQKVNNTIAERIVDSGTGGKVKLDLDNPDTLLTSTGEDGTKVSFGTNVSLPSNMASDIPLYANAKNIVVSFDTSGKNGTLTQGTADDVEPVFTFLSNSLIRNGFQKTSDTALPQMHLAIFKKEKITMTISVAGGGTGDESLKTNISINRQEQL